VDGWLLDFDPGPALAVLARRGAAHADLFAEDTAANLVIVESGQLETLSRRRQRGMALRVVGQKGQFQLAASTAIDAKTAIELADDLSRSRPFGSSREPVEPDELEIHRVLPAIHPASLELEERARLAKLADKVARSTSPRVEQVRVSLRDVLRSTAIAATDGRLRGAHVVRVVLSIEVIARDGDRTETAHEAIGGLGGFEQVDEPRVTEAARIAATRAVKMLDARPAPAGVMPVVLAAEAGGTFVHEAVGHPLEGDLVIEGLSVFQDRMGDQIAASILTVADDATLPNRNGSFAIDDEGAPAERTVLIDRGVLRSFLLDERTALLFGGKSTGKGRRESFRDRPLVRMSNTIICPGEDDPSSILRDTHSGLYVVRMGGGEVDTVSGQFVFEVSEAYLIEGGKIGDPVRGATLTGDTQAVLQSIDRVGRDLGFGIGTCGKDGQDVPIADGEPTIRIPEIVVGGSG
jgi:TldD protein